MIIVVFGIIFFSSFSSSRSLSLILWLLFIVVWYFDFYIKCFEFVCVCFSFFAFSYDWDRDGACVPSSFIEFFLLSFPVRLVLNNWENIYQERSNRNEKSTVHPCPLLCVVDANEKGRMTQKQKNHANQENAREKWVARVWLSAWQTSKNREMKFSRLEQAIMVCVCVCVPHRKHIRRNVNCRFGSAWGSLPFAFAYQLIRQPNDSTSALACIHFFFLDGPPP